MKKLPILAFCLFGLASVSMAADHNPRERIRLDAGWKFHQGEVLGQTSAVMTVPIKNWQYSVEQNGPAGDQQTAGSFIGTPDAGWMDVKTGEDVFHGRVGHVWYRTTLPPFSSRTPLIHFERIDDSGTIYLNGKLIATHNGWDEPFDVDLRPAWHADGPNILMVLVENTAGEGGITRPATLQNGPIIYSSGPMLSKYDDRSWSTVHLPHDYVVAGRFTSEGDAGHGSLPTPTAWYRKKFDLPSRYAGKSIWIDFDGVYRDSMVWFNGHYLGKHPSGYTSFRYDVAKFARFGGANVLSVHVDPSRFEGWWYEGGGIYRHVWLNVADPVHATPWGAYVKSDLPEPGPGHPAKSALVTARVAVTNESGHSAPIAATATIVDDTGKPAGSATAKTTIPANGGAELVYLFEVANPRLWSLESPHLYRLVTQIKQRSHTIDSTATTFGIRTIRYDKDGGFFLNGKHVKMQGTCNHQDFIGVGIGVSDQLEAWRVKKLKGMGSNAWRMSHNPPTPELLDACDRLGMLVMDENRHLGDSKDNLAEVASMVLRDRNHPSIVMWSMCNEQSEAGYPNGRRMFKAMQATVLQYDRTRPVSSAMNSGWFGNGFTGVEDLMGVNYNIDVYDKFHSLHPDIPMFGSETASTVTTRGEYSDDRSRVVVSSYNMTDETWSSIASRPFMAGSFVWTGFDYKGEPSPYGWPCINSHFGIMDMCGFPKDNYYYYQSWWKADPIVHLLPHWNWSGREGKEIKVVAFSNAAVVELYLNGKSLGAKDMPRFGHVEWNVKYVPGSLVAKAYDALGNLIATDRDETTGPPAAIRLTTDRHVLDADGEDVAVVYADVVDAKGRIVPTASNAVRFNIAGVGEVAGVGNGDPGDHDPDVSNLRRAFHGRCAAVIRGGERAGWIHLTAVSPGVKSGVLNLNVGGVR
ncbi:MAG: beta-galactosidase GalA [Fimbriimonas sp.]|nr:beta-galactosidase GalA [Fimbriimonas sp.]